MRPHVLAALLVLAAGSVASGIVAQEPTPASPVPLTVKGLPEQAPLTVAAVRDGLVLQVQVKLQPGWHLYGRDTGGGQPVAIELGAGAFAAAAALQTPMDKEGLITGDAELKLPLRRVADGESLRATMKFMVCDALQCLPPITLTLATPDAGGAALGPAKVLLVAIDDGERTQRIAAFLTARGFVPTVTTYAKVTAQDCDASDLVLADSPTFGQCKGQSAKGKAFPETSAPVVAVGFLGTVLLEAQKVAMACGYI